MIQALPIEPLLPVAGEVSRLSLRSSSAALPADSEVGGEPSYMPAARGGITIAFFGGAGGRHVGLLQSGGPVENPNPSTPIGRYPQVRAMPRMVGRSSAPALPS